MPDETCHRQVSFPWPRAPFQESRTTNTPAMSLSILSFCTPSALICVLVIFLLQHPFRSPVHLYAPSTFLVNPFPRANHHFQSVCAMRDCYPTLSADAAAFIAFPHVALHSITQLSTLFSFFPLIITWKTSDPL